MGRDGFSQISGWEELSPVVVRTGSGGAHVYFRHDEVIRNSTSEQGVDVRGEGGYVIAPGSPGYSFLKGGIEHFQKLPPFPEQWRAKSKGTHVHQSEKKARDLELVWRAVQVIPNPSLGWEEWNRIGMAIFAASDGGDRGFEAFDFWSQKNVKQYDASNTRERWDSYANSRPTEIGAGTLFHLASQHDPDWRRSAYGVREVPRIYWHGSAHEAPRWLIRNRLPEAGVGLLVGQWGTYKTFMALDISAHVILGTPWTGEPIKRRGGVLLLAGEGATGLELRLAALVEKMLPPASNGSPKRKLPFAWVKDVPVLQENGSLESLVSIARAVHENMLEEFSVPLVLILVDTVAQTAGWKDENDSAEATRVMRVLRSLSEQTGALVLGVDHLGKSVEQGTRGSSAKEANSDVVLLIQATRDTAGGVTDTALAIRKLRDGPQGEVIPFDAPVVMMGRDEEGFQITSRIIDWNVVRAARRRKVSESETVLHDSLQHALAKHGVNTEVNGQGGRAVAKEKVYDVFAEKWRPDKGLDRSAIQQRFRQALQAALEAGEVGKTKDGGSVYLWWIDHAL